MNIGFMYGVFTYPPRMGGSVHGYQLARGLISRKHKLYTWYYGNEDYPYCKHFRGREILRFLRTIDVLYVRIEFPNFLEHINLLRLLLYTRVPTALEFNALPSEVRFYSGARLNPNKVAKRLCRLTGRRRAAIGVTEGIRRYLEEEIGFRKTYCIPNGSDPELFLPRTKQFPNREPLKIVWIGQTNIRWHDINSIIQVAEILDKCDANVLFRIYGDPTYLPHSLPPNLKVYDLVPYERIGAEIADADVGLHILKPSEHTNRLEYSPLKIFDYMACGLAIITQGDGQRGQIIREWKNGLTTSGAPEDLADKIQILEKDRKLCMRLGENGRRAVKEYYNWDRVAKETEEILMELIK